MEKTFKISTIIPVYNTEKYLEETVESILCQTIGFAENIQLIFVNDCSTDQSGKLCEAFQSRYPHNVVYINKEKNAGASAARNTGLKAAKGNYVNFLDSDDKWSANAYQRMLDFLEENSGKIDMVSSDVWYFDAKEGAHALNQNRGKDCVVDMEQDYKMIRSLGSNCLVKRETAEKFPFHEKQKCWEDSLFINTVILNKKKYGMLAGDVKFFYRTRADFSSTSDLLYRKTKRYYLKDLTYLFDGLYEQSMKYCGCFAPMCQYFMMNAVQVRFQEEMPDSLLSEEETRAYEKILRGILERIDDRYIREIAYTDELQRKIMLAFKYGADLREDIRKLQSGQNALYGSLSRTKKNNALLVRWVRMLQQGKRLESYFFRKGYQKIAVYGMSDLGRLLAETLRKTEIELLYGIDRRAERLEGTLSVYKPQENLPKADAIVVTAVYFFEEICGELRKNGVEYPIISLDEVIDFMEREDETCQKYPY